MMMRFKCPKCGSSMDVPDDSAGRTAACPQCGNVNVVPPPVAPYSAAGPACPAPLLLSEKDARMWAMLCHVGGLAGYIVPFGHIIAPLVIWLTQKDKSSFVDAHGKEALNFQITWTIYTIVAAILVFVFCIGVVLVAALAVTELILIALAAIKAHEGKPYRYPLTIRLIS